MSQSGMTSAPMNTELNAQAAMWGVLEARSRGKKSSEARATAVLDHLQVGEDRVCVCVWGGGGKGGSGGRC
jgi:hypothetical protein